MDRLNNYFNYCLLLNEAVRNSACSFYFRCSNGHNFRNIMVAFDAFSKSMKNANLIEPIIAAMGFAMVLQITKCDQHLIYLLAKSLKNLGPLLVPGAVLATALVNTSITSAGGCSAAVGAILIPVLIGAGVHPAMAAAAVFAGTYGSPMLNPGFGQIAIVADVAHSTPIDVISNHYHVVLILGLITAISLTIVAFVKGEHKGYHSDTLDHLKDFKINYIMAIVPMLPLIILILGSTGTVPLFKKFAISHAMLIGCAAAFLATRKARQKFQKHSLKVPVMVLQQFSVLLPWHWFLFPVYNLLVLLIG